MTISEWGREMGVHYTFLQNRGECVCMYKRFLLYCVKKNPKPRGTGTISPSGSPFHQNGSGRREMLVYISLAMFFSHGWSEFAQVYTAEPFKKSNHETESPFLLVA
jgi:hypothetical protein